MTIPKVWAKQPQKKPQHLEVYCTKAEDGVREFVSLEEQACYKASGKLFLLFSTSNHPSFIHEWKWALGVLITTHVLLGITYLTEREKSPGALSLSLMRKAPSCLCLPNISSAFARGIFPKNHLWSEEKKTEEVKNSKRFMHEPDTDIHTEVKWFLTEAPKLHLPRCHPTTGYWTIFRTFCPGNEATMMRLQSPYFTQFSKAEMW